MAIGPDIECLHRHEYLTGGPIGSSAERDRVLGQPTGKIGAQGMSDANGKTLAPAAGVALLQFVLADPQEYFGRIEIIRHQNAFQMYHWCGGGAGCARRRITCAVEYIDISRRMGRTTREQRE